MIFRYSGLEVQCNKNTLMVGETMTCSCSSDIGTLSWNSSSGEFFDSESLNVLVDTGSHEDVYTCTLSSSCGSQQESVTVEVIGISPTGMLQQAMYQGEGRRDLAG